MISHPCHSLMSRNPHINERSHLASSYPHFMTNNKEQIFTHRLK